MSKTRGEGKGAKGRQPPSIVHLDLEFTHSQQRILQNERLSQFHVQATSSTLHPEVQESVTANQGIITNSTSSIITETEDEQTQHNLKNLLGVRIFNDKLAILLHPWMCHSRLKAMKTNPDPSF